MSVQFGIGTFAAQAVSAQSHADVYEQLLSLARVADEVGIDSFWVSSHHGTPNGHIPSPLLLLAAVAATTSRIRLGTAMVIAPFQHPLRFAEDCATLSRLSGGRLQVGVGLGWRDEEFDAFAVPMEERVARTIDLVRASRAAWEQDVFSLTGDVWRFEDVALGLHPEGRIPILMGGRAPRAVARAGRLADGFVATGTPERTIRPDELREQLEMLDRAARDVGRDPDELLIGVQLDFWVSHDGAFPPGVAAAMWNQIGGYLRWHGTSGADDPTTQERVLGERVVRGTPNQVAEALAAWIDEFGDRRLTLIFRLHYPGVEPGEAEAAVRLLAAEVLPVLRRRQEEITYGPAT